MKTCGMWLASPSTHYVGNLLNLHYYGDVYSGDYDNTDRGFRPLVCLKSNTKIEKQEDNTYILK